MNSLHRRSSSVCREPSLSSYRPSFSNRIETSSRYSRASSCDPSARSSSRPPRPSMSTSYHSDFSTRPTPLSYTSRYASTGNLSASLRSSYSSSNYRSADFSSTYRASDSYRTPSTYRASSTFTPRYESRLPPRDFSSSSLSKYRPENSSISRPTYTSNHSSSYSSRPRTEFRSKTPAASEPSMKHGRYDRDYKSLTRFEKTPVTEDKSEDEVENTFQQLYHRYVKGVDLEEKPTKRKFISHSEAEETNSEEESGESSLAEILQRRKEDASMTPKGPSPSVVTPVASPVPKKKIIDVLKEEEHKKSQTAEEFRQKHSDVQMKPAVIEARILQPPVTAMSNLLKLERINNLTTKISDAFHKKKTETNQNTSPANEVNPTPCFTKKPRASEPSPVAPSVVPVGKPPGGEAPKEDFFKAPSPKPATSPSPVISPTANTKVNSTSTGSASQPEPAVIHVSPTAVSKSVSLSPSKDTSNPPTVKTMDTTSLAVPMITGNGKNVQRATTEEPKREALRSPGSKAKSSSPRPKPALTIDTKKAEEASTSVTILMPKAKKEENQLEAETETSKLTEGEKKKTRDRNRTLEKMLKEVANKKNLENQSSITRPPPLLLVTQASVPSTPKLPPAAKEEWGSGSGSYYGSDEDVDEEEGWTEGEDERDYDSDLEFCISETFRIPTKTRIDLYPPSVRGSPFVSDYESDGSAPFLAAQKWEDSRGRVTRLFAVPPPTFTCSVTYDGQESWDSDSVHSCEESEDDDVDWRPASSSLAAYRSPGPFESDDDLDGAHFCDSVQVGCTLKLVDKAARKASDESDSEYYDDEEYSEEEYWDEEEEYEEEEEFTEEDEDYMEEEEEEEEYMMSAEEKSPTPILYTASIEEEQVGYDETEEALFDMSFEVAEPLCSQAVQPVDSTADKYREVTYTQDLEMNNPEETTAAIGQEEQPAAKAVAKRIKKDGTTETAHSILTPQMVAPIEERLNLMETKEVPPEMVESLSPLVVSSETATSAVNVVPTYTRALTEKVQEEFTNRFSSVKPSTDFAKKAVIQPAKLEKVKLKEAAEVKEAPPPLAVPKTAPESTGKLKEESGEKKEMPKPPVEDKSAVRKSTLNMKEEDAKKKVVADEQAARQKARRFGTVGALADIFKPKEEHIVYKRSSRLEPKVDELRTRRKYEIVKPVLNDEFDQQMKEIRAQMMAGSSQLQSEIKNLSKGISSLTEEAKKRELDDKHRQLLDKASGVFHKAEEEKQKWRERKMGKPAEKEKAEKAVEHKTEVEAKKEPKRTIRRIKRDKDEAKAEKTVPVAPLVVEAVAVVSVAKETGGNLRKDRAPVVNPVDALRKPSAPTQDIVVDDNNLELLKAATKVAIRNRDISIDVEKDKEGTRLPGPSTFLEAKIAKKIQGKLAGPAMAELKPPKSEGTTKTRNSLASTVSTTAQTPHTPLKRYATRRKTQEIVNESSQPKRRRRVAARHGKFIGKTHDIDELLGWSAAKTFEAMELYFTETAVQKISTDSNGKKKRRAIQTRIWISDLTDIDKLYKVSEMRDIKASVEAS